MVYEPRSTEQVRTSMIGRLKGKIKKLTNFAVGSFNYLWTTTFSQQQHETEVALLAVQLAGLVDYAGGPITQQDLDKLGVENVEPAEINPYMRDEDLDELAKIVGVQRNMGETAQAKVEFQLLSPGETIPKGTEVGTQPADGSYLSYFTTESVTASPGVRKVIAPVEAEETGDQYNVGAGRINFMANPLPIMDGVENPEPAYGGQDPENNEQFRKRIKNSVVESSGGGTVGGIEAFVRKNVHGVLAVEVDEYHNANPPHAEVVVDGGKDSEVLNAIELSHPSGVRHDLARPRTYIVDVSGTVEGSNIDVSRVETALDGYIEDLDLGQELIRDQIIFEIMDAAENARGIGSLTISIVEEKHTYYKEQNVYNLEKKSDKVTKLTGKSGGSKTTFVEGTDFKYNSSKDTIDWSLSGTTPDDRTDFHVSYDVPDDVETKKREKVSPGYIDLDPV